MWDDLLLKSMTSASLEICQTQNLVRIFLLGISTLYVAVFDWSPHLTTTIVCIGYNNTKGILGHLETSKVLISQAMKPMH